MVCSRARSDIGRVMKKFWLLSLSAALLAGCAATDNPPVSANVRPGAVCTGCGATWVMSNDGSSGKPGTYSMHRKYRHSNCPICAQMAAKFMSTHRVEGSCPKCGKEMRPCMFEVRGSQVKKTS